MLKEFRAFILRGNVVDLAVGIVIGAAFSKIVSSFVADVMTPPIGVLLGKLDFKHLGWTLTTGKDGAPVKVAYGSFLQATIDFIIVAAAVFVLVKLVNRLQNLKKKEEAAAAPTTKTCAECAMEIPVKAKKCGHCLSVVTA